MAAASTPRPAKGRIQNLKRLLAEENHLRESLGRRCLRPGDEVVQRPKTRLRGPREADQKDVS
jgi:hypothetical protein